MSNEREGGDSSGTESADLADRLIGHWRGSGDGPTVICTAGIHGNEGAGVLAVQRVLARIEADRLPLRGEFVGFRGNLRALRAGRRFLDEDLNRVWTESRLASLSPPEEASSEHREQMELREAIESVLEQALGPVWFMDLHTSSAEGNPFICIGDTLKSRAFSFRFPLPVILGLEETVEGALLERMTSRGYASLGAEGGQHDAPESAKCLEAVIWTGLDVAGALRGARPSDFEAWGQCLRGAAEGIPRVLELVQRHGLAPGDGFEMLPGFRSFRRVARGDLLARDHGGEIRAQYDGRILLPLYQAVGDEGFFLVRGVKPFWIWISWAGRHLGLGALAHWLPGVRRDPERPGCLRVDRRVARGWVREIFHLLGYRKQHLEGENTLVVERHRSEH